MRVLHIHSENVVHRVYPKMTAVSTAPPERPYGQVGVALFGDNSHTQAPTRVPGHNVLGNLRRRKQFYARFRDNFPIFALSAVE